MQNASPSAFRNIAIAIAVILVAIMGYLIYLQTTFRIVSTDPNLSSFSIATAVLKVNFSHALLNADLVVDASNDIMTSASVSGKTLSINLKPILNSGQTYTVTIKSISDTKGKHIMNKNLKFTAKTTDFTKSSPAQQQATLQRQQQRPAAQSDPILAHLPYANLDFRLDPVFTQTQLVIQAQLYVLPNSSTSEAEQAAQATQEVISYIQALGLNPSKYNIQYQTVEETLQGT